MRKSGERGEIIKEREMERTYSDGIKERRKKDSREN